MTVLTQQAGKTPAGRWRAALLALAALWAALWAGMALAADPYSGAKVDANARYYALVCGTCSIDSASVYSGVDGGPGATLAALGAAGVGWDLSGSAALTGPNSLPQLGGFAFADIVLDPSIPKTYFYKAGLTAQGTQKYDFSGAAPQTYQIDYTLDGSFTLGSADAVSLMSVLGGLTVYGSNYNPFGEFRGTVLGSMFSNDHASLAGTEPFALAGSVSFTVNPGDSFYVWSLLDVYADSSHQVMGTVDAAHTLALQFSAGDTSLLSASVSAVPESPTLALFAAGLGLIMFAARRLRSDSDRG